VPLEDDLSASVGALKRGVRATSGGFENHGQWCSTLPRFSY
jgi:hypothetical protein